MTIEAIIALAAAVFVFSLKPGPGIMTSMSYSMSHGARGLFSFIAGFNIGLAIFLAVVFIGLMGVNQLQIDMLFIGILAKSIAALYLITIGVKELQRWNEVIDTDMTLGAEKAKTSLDIGASAIILTISNPMVIVFYASIIPVFINPENITVSLSIMISAMLMVIDSFGMVVYCLPLLIFRKKVPDYFMKYIKLLSAVIIISIGIYIGYTAVFAKDVLSVFEI